MRSRETEGAWRSSGGSPRDTRRGARRAATPPTPHPRELFVRPPARQHVLVALVDAEHRGLLAVSAATALGRGRHHREQRVAVLLRDHHRRDLENDVSSHKDEAA